jgi:predicted DCC family thiol-disulfide oxidoreductase YuxK
MLDFPYEGNMAGARETMTRYTVIYDGACGVCRRSVDLLARWDTRRELEILPSQAPEVRERFPWIPEEDLDSSVQVVDARAQNPRRWQGAAAIEELLNALPRGRGVSWLFRIPLVRPVAEWAYRKFARNRMRFGCGDHCRLRE